MSNANNENQESFAQSLRAFAEKAAQNNPVLKRLRDLSQALVGEMRRCSKEGLELYPLAATIDGNGVIVFVKTDGQDSTASIITKLKNIAQNNEVVAAAFCTVTNRIPPNGTAPIYFIEIHSEDKTTPNTAWLAGKPLDDTADTALNGTKGPATLVYGKKIPPAIFNN